VIDPKVREQLDSYLASKGLRRTKPREVIIEAAFATTEHFTADELLDMARKLDRTVSRATVYRTLSLLVECGLLREVDLGRDQTYYDPNFLEKPQHNHLICTDCDKVVEFDPALPPCEDASVGGFAYRDRLESDGDLLIRVNEHTHLSDEGRKVWSMPKVLPDPLMNTV
jgi:Fe2+ or Zn2+ uptake regulation protein